MTDAVAIAPIPAESRTAPRVAAGRPARLRLHEDLEERSFQCAVVDLSSTGCRLLLQNPDVPRDWTWSSDLKADIALALKTQGSSVVAPVEIVWSQHTREAFVILGCRFREDSEHTTQAIADFVLQRLRAGTAITEVSTRDDEVKLKSLDVALEAELTWEEASHPCRILLHETGEDHLLGAYAFREGEEAQPVKVGQAVDIRVFPPSWARGERRTLRFAAVVSKADMVCVELAFQAEGNDLAAMIRNLIPEKIERASKPVEVNSSYILLILAALFIALLIASLNSKH